MTADPMANFYDNTLTVVSQNGHNHLWYNADHTFSGLNVETGAAFSGTWRFDDGRICTHVTGAAEPYCGHLGFGRAVGDDWEDHRPDGGVSRLRLTAGRDLSGAKVGQ